VEPLLSETQLHLTRLANVNELITMELRRLAGTPELPSVDDLVALDKGLEANARTLRAILRARLHASKHMGHQPHGALAPRLDAKVPRAQ
jgi:hypothetical protein